MTAEEIAEAVAAAVRTALAAERPALPRLLYTTEEAAQITGLPVSFFEHEAPARRIPSRKIGERHRRYSMADLEAIVAASEQAPLSGPMAGRR